MHSSISCRDPSNTSLGQRRGKSDLARFSLEASWPRGVSDSGSSWAYPSPPMSGSPPLPPRRNPEFDDRSQAGLGLPSREVQRGWQTSQTELPGSYRVTASVGPPYQQEPPSLSQYTPFQRVGDVPVDPSQYQYQQPQQRVPPPQMGPLPMYPLRHPHPQSHFHEPERFPIAEEPGYSPKAQRKTKGHVASACVPCKRAHLRCDAQRPCSRCVGNGKEESCIDVQHKKRGRPRLRDEREQRFESLSQTFSPQPDHHLRRSMPMYSPSGSPMHQMEGPSRAGPYRVLKSQQSGPPMVPRFLEHASPADAAVYSGSTIPAPRHSVTQETAYAYLDMEFRISTASPPFCGMLGVLSVGGRKLTDIVAPVDHEKIFQLRRAFENERQEREPNYLPPIYGKSEEDRMIQSGGLNLDRLQTERHDTINFQDPSGQMRPCQVRIATPATQEFYQTSSFPYHSREGGTGYRPPQQPYGQPPQVTPYPHYPAQYGEARVQDAHVGFRQPAPLLPSNTTSGSGPIPGIPSYSQPFQRAEYGQAPTLVPRSEVLQIQPQRQHELTLPPLQGQRILAPPATRADDRGGRVDIGGLLEKPESRPRQ